MAYWLEPEILLQIYVGNRTVLMPFYRLFAAVDE